MIVVVCNPGDAPASREIGDELEALQGCVGGSIELVRVRGVGLDGFDVFVNEDGLWLEQSFNRWLGHHFIVGPIVVSKSNAAGEQVSLSAPEVETVIDALRHPTGR
jgi:hypothetical protein